MSVAAREKKTVSAKLKKRITNTVVHVFLTILSLVWLFPIFWVIMTSLRKERGSFTRYFFPKDITFDNYIKLFTDRNILDFPQMFLNTIIVAVFSCILTTFIVLAVAYCMSRLRYKARKPFMNVAIILGLFPGFMSMFAVYYILKTLGLSEGAMIRVALILVYSAGAGTGFYVAKGFFDTIPKTLDEAAFLDGATKWTVFTRIIMPLSRPIAIYTIITSFIAPWLDFIFVRVICRANAEYYTVSLGMWRMLEKEYIDAWFTSFCAAAVCVSIPIATLFIIVQRFYVEGMSSGAVKG